MRPTRHGCGVCAQHSESVSCTLSLCVVWQGGTAAHGLCCVLLLRSGEYMVCVGQEDGVLELYHTVPRAAAASTAAADKKEGGVWYSKPTLKWACLLKFDPRYVQLRSVEGGVWCACGVV